jgi:hypothetical protein
MLTAALEGQLSVVHGLLKRDGTVKAASDQVTDLAQFLSPEPWYYLPRKRAVAASHR